MEQRETLTMEQRLLLFPCFPNASDAEIEVAKILIHLPHMISEFETPLPIPLALVWGCKGKRSVLALKNDGGASTLRRLIGPDFLSSLPLWASLAPRPLAAKAPPPPPVPNAVKEETSSPDTPLCFEPSESDEKQPDHLRSKLLGQKRKTEEWITIVDELTSKKKLRNQELENVKRFFEKMDGRNLELKARKEEEEEPRLGSDPSPEPTDQLSQPAQLTSVTPPQTALNQEPDQHPQQVKMPMRLGHKLEEEPRLDTDLSLKPTEQLSQLTQLTFVTPPQAAPNQEPYQHPQQVKMPMRLGHKQEEEPHLDTDPSPEPTEQLSQPAQLTSVTPPQAAPNQEPYQHPQHVKMPMPMQMQIPPPPSVIFYQHQLQQLIMDQTAKNQRREFNVGPRGCHVSLCFKDSIVLNSSQPFDLGLVNKDMIRKRAAEARQRRLEICRVKKPRFHSR